MGGLIKVAIKAGRGPALILLTVLFEQPLRNIPIQMSPDIEKPILEVRAAPALRLRMSTVESWRGWKASCPALTG